MTSRSSNSIGWNGGRGVRAAVSEPEDEREDLVNGAELIYVEASIGAPGSPWVDDRRLLDEDACASACTTTA